VGQLLVPSKRGLIDCEIRFVDCHSEIRFVDSEIGIVTYAHYAQHLPRCTSPLRAQCHVSHLSGGHAMTYPRHNLWQNVTWSYDETLAVMAEEAGVDARRVAWSTFFSKDSEFLVKGLADIFLDTPNFNAHTTGDMFLGTLNTPQVTCFLAP